MAREDYEIYKTKFGTYRFKVDYYGVYDEPTLELAQAKVEVIKEEVAQRLDYIEKENKKYFDNINKIIEQRAAMLKKAKKNELAMKKCEATFEDKKAVIKYILLGYDINQIAEKIPHLSKGSISRIMFYFSKGVYDSIKV